MSVVMQPMQENSMEWFFRKGYLKKFPEQAKPCKVMKLIEETSCPFWLNGLTKLIVEGVVGVFKEHLVTKPPQQGLDQCLDKETVEQLRKAVITIGLSGISKNDYKQGSLYDVCLRLLERIDGKQPVTPNVKTDGQILDELYSKLEKDPTSALIR